MRKFIYILCILWLGGLLVYQGFFAPSVHKKSSFDSLDFTDSQVFFHLQSTDNTVSQTKITSQELSKLPKNAVVYEKIDMVDGVYHPAGTTITVSKTPSKPTNITLSNGEFIFAINNLFESFTINGADFSIEPKTPGYFFIQNTPGNVRIYSYNSVLSIDLLTGKTITTNFHLFPSLLFTYNSQYNNNLLRADILRIATINSISFVSAKASNALSTITGGTSRIKKDTFQFIDLSQQHIKKQLVQYTDLFSELIDQRTNDLGGASLIESYPFLFVNDSKKDIFFKNQLAHESAKIFEIAKNPLLWQNLDIEAFLRSVRAFRDTSSSTRQEGIALLKLYTQIFFFATDPVFPEGKISTSLFLDALGELDTTPPSINRNFLSLSKLFLTYQFWGSTSTTWFEKLFNAYLVSTIENQKDIRQDFSFFAFFLGQYIISGDQLSEYFFSKITHFITIANLAFGTLDNATDIRKIHLDSTLFTYDKINTAGANSLLKTFFESTEKGLVIKDQYLSAGTVQQNIFDITSLEQYIASLSRDLETKKAMFYLYNGQTQPGVTDLYVKTVESTRALDRLLKIFKNYPEYRQNLELDSLNRTASRLSVDTDDIVLSKENIQSYLGQFNGVKLDTLQLLNNFTNDKYYRVQVMIHDRIFSFRLNPIGNVIDELKITDTTGQLIKSEPLSVSLDEKEKWLKDLAAWAEDPAKKYQYDFKNFFAVSYLSSTGGSENISISTVQKEMTPQMKVFVQQNLLDGDFKLLQGFLQIPGSSVYTTIEGGEYRTELSKIQKHFSDGSSSDGFSVELDGFYVFARHSFFRLSVTVKDPNGWYRFWGYGIDILPAFIPVQDTKKVLEPLGKYLSVLSANYTSGAKNLKIDLNSHTVSIDSQSFPVTY